MIITYARPEDEAFIMDSFLRSWKEAPDMARVRPDLFFAGARRLAEKVFEAKPMILVIRDESNDEKIVAWMIASTDNNVFVLHWSYTKRPFRRKGYFNALLAKALEIAGPERSEELEYANLSRMSRKLDAMGFTYRSAKT